MWRSRMTSTIRTTNVGPAAGGTTTNLMNGLAKAWCTVGVSGNSLDSFNVSSVDDDATGKVGINFTANFNNATYVPTSAITYSVVGSDYQTYLGANYGPNLDASRTSATCHFGSWETNWADPNGGTNPATGSYAMNFVGDLA